MPDRILLVRLGALGDIVHAIPVAAALRRAFPRARIDWLVSAKHREILDLVPVLDERIALDDRSDSGGGLSTWAAVRALRRARYDVAIDMQGLLKSAVLSRASGARTTIGFAPTYLRERAARFFYTQAYDPGCDHLYDPREARHVVDVNLGLLETIGIANPAKEFPLARGDARVADAMRVESGGAYAILNPGAAWPNKRWPPARFAATAAAMRERHGLRSVVLWGPGEEAIAREVGVQAGGAAILSPPTTIAAVVELMRGAAVVVSGDTGPTHIAAAVGAPVIGLYGPTRPQRNGPWSAEDITISRYDSCACHHLRQCRRASMCLLEIDVSEVVAAIDRRLSMEPRRGAR